MNWRRLNNAVHRDLGYFLAGASILYAISGLALNHADDWNPNFTVVQQEVQTPTAKDAGEISRQWIIDVLRPLGESENYRSHDSPSPSKLKVYLDDGSVLIDLAAGKAVYESVRRRPILFRMNCLHISPKRVWRLFSDFFAVGLIIVSATGLFVRKGRQGIAGRGAMLASIGVIVPLIFALSVR